jgi:hypothetical protein
MGFWEVTIFFLEISQIKYQKSRSCPYVKMKLHLKDRRPPKMLKLKMDIFSVKTWFNQIFKLVNFYFLGDIFTLWYIYILKLRKNSRFFLFRIFPISRKHFFTSQKAIFQIIGPKTTLLKCRKLFVFINIIRYLSSVQKYMTLFHT